MFHAEQPPKLCHVHALQLFTAIVPLQRGITALEQDQQEVERLIQQLEKVSAPAPCNDKFPSHLL